MLRFRTDLIGLAPFIAVMIYLWGRITWAASRYGGYPFFTALGFTVLIFGTIVFILGLARTFIITRWFLFFFGLGLLAIGILFAIVGEFKGMYYLIMACWYEGVYGIVVGQDIVRHRVWYPLGKNKERKKLNKATRGQLIGLTLIAGAIVSGIIFTQAWQLDKRTELQFTVSKDEMQGKELVLYWVRQTMADPSAFVNVLKATNTVLALQGNPDLFQGLGVNNNSSVDAANLVRLCNQAGVKVEIWPVPSQSLPCALSLRYVDCMPVVYQYFKDWLHRNNITVTYYAFDIEDGDQWTSFANSTVGRITPHQFPFYDLYNTLNGIYDMAARQQFLRVNRSNWAELLAKQQALIDQIRSDGFIPRATINPGAAGALDGDLSGFIQNYEQSYDIKGYDYLSSMYYRSCEGGNNDSTYKVYQNARILHEISTYNRTAICIGCIAYPAYRTAMDVANDVWLSCANGADSVRIFLGDSWVYSAVNESAGIQSLHSMLDLCRAGGTAITEYHAKWDNDLFITILGSVFGDL